MSDVPGAVPPALLPALLPTLPLVYADAAFLVLDKPAGLLCVPGRGADKQDALSTRAQAVYPDALIVHRLDMATSGLVLMARGIENQRRLSAAFEARKVGKRYVAWVAGLCDAMGNVNGGGDGDDGEWSTIDLPIGADWPNRPRQMVDHEHGKASATRWRQSPTQPAHGFSGLATRVELEPLTGRTHQLRVHMAAIGHPILGDALYACGDLHGDLRRGADRLMLHATQLSFPHPVTGAALHFHGPVPF